MSAVASPRTVSPLKEATENNNERQVTKVLSLHCLRGCEGECARYYQNDTFFVRGGRVAGGGKVVIVRQFRYVQIQTWLQGSGEQK